MFCSAAVCPHGAAACLALESKTRRRLSSDDLAAAQQHLSSSTESQAGAHQEAAQQLLASVVSGADEFAPVCAVLAGIIANNVVAAVSGSEAPLNNLLYFTLFDGRAIVEHGQPEGSSSSSSRWCEGGVSCGAAARAGQRAG